MVSIWIKYWRQATILIIPILLLPLLLLYDAQESKCGYAVLLIGFYWALQPVHIAVTGLVPIFLLPALGLMESGRVCEHYLQESNVVFLASLILAVGIESSDLHRRIALRILTWVGTEFQWILLGSMVTTMFIAIWIINTAAAAMMLPILDALCQELFPGSASEILQQLQTPLKASGNGCGTGKNSAAAILAAGSSGSSIEATPEEEAEGMPGAVSEEPDAVGITRYDTKSVSESQRATIKRLRDLFYLAIAYSATIGGTTTLTSNGPNLVLKFLLDQEYTEYGHRPPVDYASWLFFCLPATLLTILLIWFVMKMIYLRGIRLTHSAAVKQLIRSRYQALGPMSFHQWATTITFLGLISLWMLRDPVFIRGWVSFFPPLTPPGDGSAAIFIVFLLFIIPARPLRRDCSAKLLDWSTVQKKVPWGILIMRGAGFALATAVKTSGLSAFLSDQLSALHHLPLPAIILIMSCISAVLTEFVSNSATATIVLPVASQLALDLGVNPLLLIVPVTLACSYAFVLPVGTPANALVFEHAGLRPSFMIIPGLITKLIAIAVMIINLFAMGDVIFGIQHFPDWALYGASVTGAGASTGPSASGPGANHFYNAET